MSFTGIFFCLLLGIRGNEFYWYIFLPVARYKGQWVSRGIFFCLLLGIRGNEFYWYIFLPVVRY